MPATGDGGEVILRGVVEFFDVDAGEGEPAFVAIGRVEADLHVVEVVEGFTVKRGQAIFERVEEELDGFNRAEFGFEAFVGFVVHQDIVAAVEQYHDGGGEVKNRVGEDFLVLELLFQLMDDRDIAVHSEEIGDVVLGIQHGRNGDFSEVAFTRFIAVDECAAPFLAALDGAP
jgi:hypothetical protein